MPLPNVNVNVIGGGLGQVIPAQDGVAWLIMGGVTTPTWLASQINLITSLKDAELNHGITKVNNPLAYAHIYDFFTIAGEGAKLYITLLPDDWASNYAEAISAINALKNQIPEEIRLVGVSPASGGTGYSANIRTDVVTSIATLNAIAKQRSLQYKPTFMVLDGFAPTGTSGFYNLKTMGENQYTSVVLSQSQSTFENYNDYGHDINACVGLLLGRLAKIPVHRNVGRVRDGDMLQAYAYLGEDLIETISDAVLEELNDKGYVFLKKHVGLGGYYFSDDPTCTAADSDFSSIARVRTIQKARRIVRQTLMPYLLDEVEVDPATGRLSAAFVKSLQAAVENALYVQMTANGEIIAPRCTIDPKQNVLATNKINVSVKIIPYGYAKQIEVTISFENPVVS